ncbi:MAG TPA: hypothetical protein VE954_03925 [Oligoflexus sp.]|uniref:hypothetical protein n=1 Tax=Oligoflexus sp. TaxID=1971216 RepID=UPI002D555DCE|nr:hypothetical protein [Oligoflexus sp.]HYX32235.1 hypothetical protein [Oligoflexus sp.]
MFKPILVLCVLFTSLKGQSKDAYDPPLTGIRVNVLWPFYPGDLYRIAMRHSLNEHSPYRTEGIVGLGISLPKNRDTEGRFSEQHVMVGVRQFFASPLNAEFGILIGPSKLENHVSTKRDYKSQDINLQGAIGYEWMVASNWSLDLQAGLAKTVAKSDPWPIYKNDSLKEEVGEEIFPIGSINVTYWL